MGKCQNPRCNARWGFFGGKELGCEVEDCEFDIEDGADEEEESEDEE